MHVKTFINVFISNPPFNEGISVVAFSEGSGCYSFEALAPSNKNAILSYMNAITDLVASSVDSLEVMGSLGFAWNVKYPPIINTTAAVVRMHAPFLKVNLETSFYINMDSTIHDQRSEHTRIIK